MRLAVHPGRRNVAALAFAGVTFAGTFACSSRPPSAPRPAAAVHRGPLTDFVPAAGLRWMVTARLQELWDDPALRKSLTLLFPPTRLDAFAVSSGVDLRRTPSALAAGFDYATLFVAETPAENEVVEARFLESVLVTAQVSTAYPGVRRIVGARGQTPETLVRIDRRLVAVSVGDPTPARIVELYAAGRLARSPTVLRGAAERTLPDALLTAPLVFLAPGPFSDEWARAARGLLGTTLAFGVGVWPDGERLRVEAVLCGDWTADDVARLSAAWTDLAGSSMGRLLGLDQSDVPPELGVSATRLTFSHRLLLAPLVNGIRAAVAADVWEFLQRAPTSGRRNTGPPQKSE